MERLTIPDERIDEHTTIRKFIDVESVREHAMGFYWRLKAYEDTGLTPEEITAMRHTLEEYHRAADPLLSAKAQGRVVVLPCKVGDVVYGFYWEKTILPMVAKWIETNTDGWCIAAQYTPMAPRFYRFSDFGKTVFLTREDAEKALEGMK